MSCKYTLKAHLIFVVKYRHHLLEDTLGTFIKETFSEISQHADFDIDIMEADLDHIYLIISYPPKTAVTSIVKKLKQESTIAIWKKYFETLRKHYWKEHTFWSDGYFVSSIGDASIETVKRYIENQGN